ncbi:MAG TPA: NAD-dependent epimerase/dehydratase family protein [Candidatus Eremiobacteraceae bacterium]|jgi:GDP-4-dehydro-6-deoxy-D-mannose reductase
MTQRYFVTGAQGFVGRYFIAHLLAREPEAEILGLGRSPANVAHFTHRVHWGDLELPAPLPASLDIARDKRYRYIAVDLGDRAGLDQALRSFRPDAIIHLASGLRDDPVEELFRTNVEGTVHLIEALAAADISVQRVVFGSTGAVYGRSSLAGRPLDEHTPCLPLDLYAASKLASEHVARILTERHGIDAVWARIFNILGPGQDERHFCGKVAAQVSAIRGGQTGAKIEVGDLSPTRDFIDVRDVATALATLVRHGEPGEAYNVASGLETAMSHVLDLALDITGLTGSVAIEHTYRRAADIPRAYADAARIRDLGFAPAYDVRRSMSDLIEYYCVTVRSSVPGA